MICPECKKQTTNSPNLYFKSFYCQGCNIFYHFSTKNELASIVYYFPTGRALYIEKAKLLIIEYLGENKKMKIIKRFKDVENINKEIADKLFKKAINIIILQ